MSTKANYFKIGVFVITAIVILIIAVIVLSAGVLMQDVLLLETYVDESVLGLSVGSPVMQRGVEIGRVEKITFVPHEYSMKYGTEEFYKYSKYVMVVIAVDRANFPKVSDATLVKTIVKQWVANGLRLKLAYQGITGIAYLEADYVDTQRYPPMEIDWEPKYLYVPSTPSILTNFTQAVDTVFQRLDRIDFEGLAQSLETALTSMNQAVKDAQIAQMRKEMVGLISEIRETNNFVLSMMDKSKGGEDMVNIPETIAQFNKTLGQMDQFVSGQRSEVEEIVANIKRASANLRELTEYAKKYPSQILLGPAPPHSEVVK